MSQNTQQQNLMPDVQQLMQSVENLRSYFDRIPIPAKEGMMDILFENVLSSESIATSLILLKEFYANVEEKENLDCWVNFGGEDGKEEEVTLSWGTITCVIMKHQAMISHPDPNETDVHSVEFGNVLQPEALQNCVKSLLGWVRENALWTPKEQQVII